MLKIEPFYKIGLKPQVSILKKKYSLFWGFKNIDMFEISTKKGNVHFLKQDLILLLSIMHLYVIIFIDLLINTIACIRIFHVIGIYTISV